MSTFSEDSNVQSGQLVPSDGSKQTHLTTLPEGALTENTSILASNEASAAPPQSITASVDGQELFLQGAGSIAPEPHLSADLALKHSSETSSAD